MENWLARTRLLLGEEAVETLRHSRVAVLGLGGVAVPQLRPSVAAVWAPCCWPTTTRWTSPI